jgi:hypothetical protein
MIKKNKRIKEIKGHKRGLGLSWHYKDVVLWV